MPDPAWPSSPPEVNDLRLRGPGAAGAATTMASGAAWQALMASNEVAFSASTVNTAVTATNFEGFGGTGSATAVTGLNAALQLLAGWVQEKPPIAASAVSAYQTAVSSMIPAEISIANRTQQAADVALNPLVLGALTPAIVALDAEYYGEHWPHNASVGVAYGAVLTGLVAALAVPPPLSPLGASPAAPASAAAAVAEATAQAATGEALKQSAEAAKSSTDGAAAPAEALSGGGHLAAAMAQPLEPIAGVLQTPAQALQGMSGVPQSLAGGFGGMFGAISAVAPEVPAAVLAGGGLPTVGAGGIGTAGPGLGSAGLGIGSAGVGSAPGSGLTSYIRPSGSFAAEHPGRPTGLKTGLLSAAEYRGPTTTALGSSALPVAPGYGGGHGAMKPASDRSGTTRARIVLSTDQPAETRSG